MADFPLECAKVKSPKVLLNSFVSASSSLLDPRQTCCFRFLVSCVSDLYLGSGLTANWINLFNALGLYIAFDNVSCSPRPALCYRPLPTFPSFLAV